MKIQIEQIPSGEDEITIKYRELTPKIQRILDVVNSGSTKLYGKLEGETVSINPSDILYIESVDEKTFAYTKKDVVRLDGSLAGMLEVLDDIRFFRCSKSMIINIEKVERLKSMSSNRIDATIEGGEHVLISRTYASEFRKILRR